MNPVRTRHLVAAAALALGLLAAPPAAGAATGLATPRPTPPPPIGSPILTAPRPDLTISTSDAAELDFQVEGLLTLSAPLTADLVVTVDPLNVTTSDDDFGCPQWEPASGCFGWLTVEIPAGETSAEFALDTVTDDGDEPAEVFGFAISTVDEDRVDVGAPAQAVLYDGGGLELGLAEAIPQDLEGDPGADGTLEIAVTANQAVPHPVTFRVHSVIAGGYNGATPPSDYTPIDVVVELAPGQTEVVVPLPLIGDDTNEEPYELVHVHVGEPSHGEIGVGSAVARILDDDGPLSGWSRPGGYQSPSRSARSAALTA